MTRRREGGGLAVGIVVGLLGCGGAVAPPSPRPTLAPVDALVAPPAASAPAKASRLTPGDMLASRAMQGAPFYVIHDEGHMLACRRWSFREGEIAGDATIATMGEPTGATRKIRIDAEASTAVVGGTTGAATVRYDVTAEDDGLSLWLATDRSERRKLFHSLAPCEAAAKREEERARGGAAPEGDDDAPRDRPGPPGPR